MKNAKSSPSKSPTLRVTYKVILMLIFTLYLSLFLQIYPPQKGSAQEKLTSPQTTVIQIDSSKNPVFDSLLKESLSVTENVKSEAQRGKQLAKIAEKQSKKNNTKTKVITIKTTMTGDTLFKSPASSDPIVIQSDSTYKPIKQGLFKRLFGKKPNKYEKK